MTAKHHNYDGHDPGGLDSLSMKLPMMDPDAPEEPNMPVILGKPPEWYCAEKDEIELGEPAFAFGPAYNQHRVPENRITGPQIDVLDQFREDFEDHIDDVDVDELSVGEAWLLGTAQLRYIYLEERWRLKDYTLESHEPELVEFDDEPQ